MIISLDLGFSGKTQGGDVATKGWVLRIYRADGSVFKEFDTLPDDRVGYDVDFIVPDDAYDPDGDNQWGADLRGYENGGEGTRS